MSTSTRTPIQTSRSWKEFPVENKQLVDAIADALKGGGYTGIQRRQSSRSLTISAHNGQRTAIVALRRSRTGGGAPLSTQQRFARRGRNRDPGAGPVVTERQRIRRRSKRVVSNLLSGHCFAVQARVANCPVRSALTVCWLTVGWEFPERGAGDGRLRSCRVVGGSLSVRV
jgi:hypothetical protein